jgi:cytochrome c553
MKNVVLLASLLAISSHAFSAKPAGDAERGEALTATCAACHGADGNSAAPAFPKLAGLGEKYLYKQMQDIRDGARPVPTMVGQVDGKTDQELADMAAYYDSQARSGAQADPALVELGEKVYRAGVAERKVAACTACHSPNGQGNAPAGFPALAGQHADYIAAQLRAYRKGYEDESGRTNDGDSKIMRSNAFGLSDKEIDAVASYASGLK